MSDAEHTEAESYDEPLVWYAGYGSNLFSERFACYIDGGTAPGCSRKNQGAQIKDPPLAERALFLPYQLYFARKSQAWQNKAVAFINPERDDSVQTLGRAWLIRRDQFADVVAQENGQREWTIDWEALADDGFDANPHGWYRQTVLLDVWDDVPVVTITDPDVPTADRYAAPGHDYLSCLIAGLRETYGFNQQGVRKYLRKCPGIDGKVDGEAINRAFQNAESWLAE